MTSEYQKSFLTYYVRSLGERTRGERSGTKYGFDWIIYNLGLADGGTPHRLPFLRGSDSEVSTTKTEPEFGVDLSFLSSDGSLLRIFVLKDEVLNNRNWGNNSFDIDLRKATAPDLSGASLSMVNKVEVVLCYNKDEDQAGITLFNNLSAALGSKIRDNVELSFDRWNLSKIVDKVVAQLISPSLLPQPFFSHFSYICSQFGDFEHGSDEWNSQLVPNWRRFLTGLLSDSVDERCVRMLPVALIVLRSYGSTNPSSATGFFDLMEWGLLAAWQVALNSTNDVVQDAVLQMWNVLYLRELELYYGSNCDHLCVPFSLDKAMSAGAIDAIASAYVAHWHIGRIGVMAMGIHELLQAAQSAGKSADVEKPMIDLLAGFLPANAATSRPLLDIHHIQLFQIWWAFRAHGRVRELRDFLHQLIHRLFTRRAGNSGIPLMEGTNALDLVFEHVATGVKPQEYCDGSSVYLMCLMELTCSLPERERNSFLELIYRRIVLGRTDDDLQMEGCEPIVLMAWSPPVDWANKILMHSLVMEGECISVDLGKQFGTQPQNGAEIADSIQQLVRTTRSNREFTFPEKIPLAVATLACLKHGSPLPPEFWRANIFPADGEATESAAE